MCPSVTDDEVEALLRILQPLCVSAGAIRELGLSVRFYKSRPLDDILKES